jgi:hypothetical protein
MAWKIFYTAMHKRRSDTFDHVFDGFGMDMWFDIAVVSRRIGNGDPRSKLSDLSCPIMVKMCTYRGRCRHLRLEGTS